MPSTHTVTLTDDQKTVVDQKATEAGVTTDVYVQAAAAKEADNLIRVTVNDWWNSLSLVQQKAVYDANQ